MEDKNEKRGDLLIGPMLMSLDVPNTQYKHEPAKEALYHQTNVSICIIIGMQIQCRNLDTYYKPY